MLVLSRMISEGIWIGDDVHLMVVAIVGDKVKIGIDAPKNVRIDRDEIRRDRLRTAREEGGAA